MNPEASCQLFCQRIKTWEKTRQMTATKNPPAKKNTPFVLPISKKMISDTDHRPHYEQIESNRPITYIIIYLHTRNENQDHSNAIPKQHAHPLHTRFEPRPMS